MLALSNNISHQGLTNWERNDIPTKFLVVPTFSFSVYLLGYFKSCLNKSCQDGDQSVSYNLKLVVILVSNRVIEIWLKCSVCIGIKAQSFEKLICLIPFNLSSQNPKICMTNLDKVTQKHPSVFLIELGVL